MKKGIKVQLTAFRDGFQSVYGGRVLLEDFINVIPLFVEAGIKHFELWGGARFQNLFFYCNENAFESMITVREKLGPEIIIQSLARGANVVGLISQSKDIIDLHAKLFKKYGVDVIRNFDALNDVRNLEYSGKCITKAEAKHEITITMMQLPPGCNENYIHTSRYYTDVLNKILDKKIPFDSICFKDASGTSSPHVVFETIYKAKKLLRDKGMKNTEITFHTHDTAGLACQQYLEAIKAGVDRIDLSSEPMSSGTGQPSVIVLNEMLKGSKYYLEGIDIEKFIIAEEALKKSLEKYFLPFEAKATNPLILRAPMPGGALTANTMMMRQGKIMYLLPKVIAEMPNVIQKGGFGTSVTPVSQIYFEQALLNIQFGPWKQISERYALMVLGYYGKTPGIPDAEILKLAQKKLKKDPTNNNPVDINGKDKSKGIKAAKKILKENGIEINDENIFIVSTCSQKGIDFLLGKAKSEIFYAENKAGIEAEKKSLAEEEKEIKEKIAVLKKNIELLKIELSLSTCEEYVLKNPELIKKVLEELNISLAKMNE